MTQVSLPQAGSGVGDSGPYTADDWAKFFEVAFTGDQAATQGVLRNYLNELEVTRSGITISIDTGAGFCYGHWLLNDTSVDITANACAGVETRWDRVVLVQNETAVAYNTNLLLPAAYAGGVPRNSCRVAILRGTCGSPGALPALLTGPNIYMVELARYQMTGGSTGAITDYRDFCNFSTEVGSDWVENRTRQFFVSALIGQELIGDNIPMDGLSAYPPSIEFPDTDHSAAYGLGLIPSDYLSDLTIRTVVIAPSNGNVYSYLGVYIGGCDDSVTDKTFNSGWVAEGVVAPATYNCITETSTPFTHDGGEFLRLLYQRNPAAAQDTANCDIEVLGWLVSYTADS